MRPTYQYWYVYFFIRIQTLTLANLSLLTIRHRSSSNFSSDGYKLILSLSITHGVFFSGRGLRRLSPPMHQRNNQNDTTWLPMTINMSNTSPHVTSSHDTSWYSSTTSVALVCFDLLAGLFWGVVVVVCFALFVFFVVCFWYTYNVSNSTSEVLKKYSGFLDQI